MTETLTLIARLTAKPDCAATLGEALQALVSPTRAEGDRSTITCTATTMIPASGFSMRTGDRALISMRILSSPTPKPSWRAFRSCWPATWN